MKNESVLVIGASGYVGSRLVPFLLQKGFRVRAAGRSAARLQERGWAGHPDVEISAVDIFDEGSVRQAMEGCRAAYFLVHSMEAGQKDFAAADRQAARNTIKAAEQAGLSRIIYLGGLGDVHAALSKHLRSRAEVAEILHSGNVPATTLRAAMIIGTGSTSFEILRYLVLRLPVMITPRWVGTRSQPVAVRNVLGALSGCLDSERTAGQVFDIGGTDVLTYRDLMDIFAEEAGLGRRIMIPVPVLTPRLSSYWVDLVTPVSAALTRPLIEGLRNEVICHNSRIRELVPQRILSCREAIRAALGFDPPESVKLPDGTVYPAPEGRYPGDPAWVGGARRFLHPRRAS